MGQFCKEEWAQHVTQVLLSPGSVLAGKAVKMSGNTGSHTHSEAAAHRLVNLPDWHGRRESKAAGSPWSFCVLRNLVLQTG